MSPPPRNRRNGAVGKDHDSEAQFGETFSPDKARNRANGVVREDRHPNAHSDEPFHRGKPKIENDNCHLQPTRWWFLSSVFPMIAGTIGPIASAFSICALVSPWRQHFIQGGDPDSAPYIPDPAWLTAVNAVQLGIALISNFFLLFNMARRIRFGIAQPITIVGWYFSAIVLICLLCTGAGPLIEDLPFPRDEMIWSQSFYYGIWAAILYFIVATLMSITFWGAYSGHYPKDFILTLSQRTLMLQTISVLIYLHVGAVVFSNIEGWRYLDAVYWADVTLFTVGFGDFTPTTNLAKALMIPYAIVGIISLGLVIGSVRGLTLEGGKRRLLARMEEKKRRRTVRSITQKGNDDILEPIQEEPGLPLTPTDKSNKSINTEYERRKAEFALMRKIQAMTSTRRKWMALAMSVMVWLVFWLVGAVVFMEAEKRYQNWTYFDAFYFCFIAWTTIGYGDFTPVSNAGKSFFVFWSLMALPTITVLISHAGDTVVKIIKDSTIRLGNVTILPGEESYMASLKHLISRMTLGKFFQAHYETTDPLIVESKRHHLQRLANIMDQLEEENLSEQEREDERQDEREEQEVSRGRPANVRQASQASSFISKVRRSLSRLRSAHQKIPTGADLHFLLISEIRAVASHLKESKNHHYDFDEWAWYLKLIGEDEHSPYTHTKANIKAKKHNNNSPEGSANEELVKWSWVGHRSPLMGSQGESEWILEKLTDRLQECLSAESRRQRGQRRDSRAHI
ncbi:voltage-gated potassium channel [Trichoderma pleuroticola]